MAKKKKSDAISRNGKQKPKQTIAPKSITAKIATESKRPAHKVIASHVSGQVIHRDTEQGLAGLRVELVDKDPLDEQPLGNAITDTQGRYEIVFTSARIDREKGGPDIVVKVLDQKGVVLGESELLRNAPTNVTIDLAVAPKAERGQSEYEEILTKLSAAPRHVPLADLTDKDISSLVAKIGVKKQLIELLVRSARLARETSLPTEVFYGLLRQDIELVLEEMLAEPEDRLRKALADAQHAGIVAALDAPIIETAMLQFGRLRSQRAPLEQLAETIGLGRGHAILAELGNKNIRTLTDVRKTGGLRFVKGLNMSPDDPAVQKLDAHARLLTLNSDVAINEALIAKGYSSIAAVAQAAPEEIARAIGDAPGSARSGALGANAKVQSAFLQNVALGFAANAASGIIQTGEEWRVDHPIHQVLPESCGCEDCDAAVSPRAYLADLMQYAIDHLRDNGAKLDLDFFKQHFHQPFSELPANCGAQNEQVRQVRICIEVLRSYLGQRPLTPAAREAPLKLAEQQYLLETYQMLLTKIGTSFTEIRLARGGAPEMQKQIADRIGVPVSALPSLFLDPGATPTQLTEASLETVFGLPDSSQPPIRQRLESAMQASRLLHLREIWKALDWPGDDYADKKLPIVDPDLLGPDDFRNPFRKASATATDKAFDLWVARRIWADGLIGMLKSVALREDGVTGTKGPDFQGIVSAMGFPYKGQARQWQPEALADIRDTLAAVTADNAEATMQALYDNYRLSPDAARELVGCWEKDTTFWKDADRAPKLTDEEWQAVYSIILRSQKNELRQFWIQEEVESVLVRVQANELRKVWTQDDDASQVLLGQREFWKSLRQSPEGDWPPVRAADVPLIDPEKIKRPDLPYSTAGGRALELWDERADALDAKRDSLKSTLETSDFANMVTEALGQVHAPATSWIGALRDLHGDLSGTDVAAARVAKTNVESDLHLSVESFQRIVTVMENQVSAVSGPLPSKADWAEVFALLASAWKEKTQYAGWHAAEIAAANGVEPWRCARHALQKWRASAEERQQWERALERRSKAQLVDPDMLASAAYLKTPGSGDAWRLWDQRRQALDAKFQSLKAQGGGANRSAATLDAMTDAELGAGSMQELAEAKAAGKALVARLQQFNLSFDAANELLRARALLSATPPQPVLDSEWESACSALTQVWKLRQLSDWQVEERTRGLSLGPDSFRLLTMDFTQFPPPAPPKLDPRRGSPDALLDWRDKLQSRIDQEQQVISALTEAMSEVEEQTLPALRDALVIAAYPDGLSSSPAGRWLGDHLGIATEYAGCHMTTRITQAIETFQIVVWGVRTGTLADIYPDLKLVAPDFDEELKWIGSYATWRAAMFVFLYPENILLPSLRRLQSPGFRRAVDELRDVTKLTPARAREVAQRYAAYFRDVCTMGEYQATVRAQTTFDSENLELLYVFAAGGDSGQIYWAAFGPSGAGHALRMWDVVLGLADKKAKVAGAGTYQLLGDKRYLYLLLTVSTATGEELGFTRYDLINRTWKPEISKLDLPPEVTRFSAALREKSLASDLPRIAIRDAATGTFYERRLDVTGLDWEGGDWIPKSQLWTPWTKLDATSVGAAKLRPGSRFFATYNNKNFPDHIYLVAVGEDGQVYGFDWNGYNLPPKWGAIPVPKLAAGLSAGTGGMTGVFRDGLLPNQTYTMPQIDLFATASDRSVYVARWDLQNGWTPWSMITDTQGIIRPESAVTAITRHPNAVNIFAMSDLIAGQMRIAPRTWGKETNYIWKAEGWGIFDESTSPEVAVLPHSGRSFELFNFKYTADEETWEDTVPGLHDWLKNFSDATYIKQTPEIVPGSEELEPSAIVTSAVRSASAIDLFAPRKSGVVWTIRRRAGTGWSQWKRIGESAPRFSASAIVSALAQGADHVVCFATDSDGEIRTAWQRDGIDEGKWQPWAAIDAPSTGAFSPNGYVATVISPGTAPGMSKLRVFTIGSDGAVYLAEALENLPQSQTQYLPVQLHPVLWQNTSAADLVIRETLSEAQRTSRPAWVKAAFDSNWYGTDATKIQAYLEEAFYFVPVHLGLQLQKSGSYIAALDWLRLVYEYTAPTALRKLVGRAPDPMNASDAYQRKIDSWLLDPLNPHAIAETRANAYTRFTLQAIVKCLLDYADSEFAKDTSESVPRARELYEAALELLDAPELRKGEGQCEHIIGELSIAVNDPHWDWVRAHTIQALKGIADVALLKQTVAKLSPLLASKAPADKKFVALQPILAEAARASAVAIPFGLVIEEARSKVPQLESAVLSKTELATAMEVALTPRAFTTDAGSPAISALIPPRPLSAFKSMSIFGFCVPPNPILSSLRMRADLNLYKIRNCRNIAGMRRHLEPFAAPTDTSSGMPTIGGGGQLVLSGVGQLQATEYRYSVLIERAKQLAQHAMQVEAAFLSALEKSDKEAFDLLSARANIRLAQAGIRLQDIRVDEAHEGIKLAQLQRDRADVQARTYEEWIDIGQLAEEQQLLAMFEYLATAQIVSVGLGAVMQGITGGVSIGLAAPFSVGLNVTYQAANLGKGIADSLGISFQRSINRLNLRISQELRMREWSLQRSLAEQDVRIGEEQIQLANDHVRITEQERVIEQIKADQAKETLDFLTNKFTNKELYDWMSGVLGGIYSFFLQQATSIAQLAADQLAFQRQEAPPRYIQDNYWEMFPEDAAGASDGAKVPDRRGLTGSARLFQDIYQLDQYAFQKNHRKQQLTKTISLAQLDPFAFQRFRETGVLAFATPMELLDRDFPGHYLRLIKRVRATMIALIPPNLGIRATLTCSGISRVVIGGDTFQTVVVRRPPDAVALSAAFNATGLFELQEQPEMLLPFEDQGVATSWEFAMPKAANPFDYSTIADVLITIEYTALNSFDYRQQIAQLLNAKRTTSADRAFSFRHQFADAWYDLSNPEQSLTPMSVGFQTFAEDFPPNVDNVSIENVALYFSRRPGSNVEFESVDLSFVQPGAGVGPIGGICRTENGLVSTRAASGSSWLSLRDSPPFGQWRLSLPNTEQTALWFKDGDITDILFVITYAGRLPEWPL